MKSRDELKQLRGMGGDELGKKLGETEQELMHLKFKHASGQLEQTAQLRALRKTIAKIKTLRQQAAQKSA